VRDRENRLSDVSLQAQLTGSTNQSLSALIPSVWKLSSASDSRSEDYIYLVRVLPFSVIRSLLGVISSGGLAVEEGSLLEFEPVDQVSFSTPRSESQPSFLKLSSPGRL